MGGKRSEEVRTGKSDAEACSALLKETKSFQHGGGESLRMSGLQHLCCNGKYIISTLKKKKTCHHELIVLVILMHLFCCKCA